MNKPSIPKGTRDFSPTVMVRRNYIFDTIKASFKRYGYLPIETPCMENLSTLTGKYGEEGDRLIFKIVDSGIIGDQVKKKIDKSKLITTISTDVFVAMIRFVIPLLNGPQALYNKKRLNDLFKKNARNIDEEYRYLLNHYYNLNKSKVNLEVRKTIKQSLESNVQYGIVVLREFFKMRSYDISFSNDWANRDLIIEEFNAREYGRQYIEEIVNKSQSNILLENLDSQILSEKALRYDLTVPFARYVVQHQNDITFPFKRYQIQPVWRADRPQKGRYREFYQCDADVVGSASLLYEVELVQLFDEVLTNLKVPNFTIKINNRKILSGIAEITGEQDKIIDITVAIDKLDKVGEEGVIKELKERGIQESSIEKIKPLFQLNVGNKEVVSKMKVLLAESEIGLKGIEELEFVFAKIDRLGLKTAKLQFDVTLARGLNYYTGAIFEVSVNDVSIGSICGGGRYDDLTGIFGLKDVSGVGISFGADRIFDVLNELNLFPDFTSESTKLLFVNFGDTEADYCLDLLKQIREADINAEIYPSSAKMKKQMKYADEKQIPYVAMIGTNEMETSKIRLKNMQSGEQQELGLGALIELLK